MDFQIINREVTIQGYSNEMRCLVLLEFQGFSKCQSPDHLSSTRKTKQSLRPKPLLVQRTLIPHISRPVQLEETHLTNLPHPLTHLAQFIIIRIMEMAVFTPNKINSSTLTSSSILCRPLRCPTAVKDPLSFLNQTK